TTTTTTTTANEKEDHKYEYVETIGETHINEWRKEDGRSSIDGRANDRDDYDSDDSLPVSESGLQEDDQNDLRKVKLPSYIRDCLKCLQTDDVDNIESGLQAVSALIRNDPFDLKHLCVNLCLTLVNMQNQFGITHFNAYRRSALTALLVVRTELIAPVLVPLVYSRELTSLCFCCYVL
ncbi:hypothetical protein RFI_33379, partial [Reticulomyxa filosa]